VDISGQLLLLPGGQPSAQLRVGGRTAVIDAHELVRQGDAERVHIDALRSAWMLELRLELQRGRPNVAVEEEQSGTEIDVGEAEIGEQRAAWVDVEETGCAPGCAASASRRSVGQPARTSSCDSTRGGSTAVSRRVAFRRRRARRVRTR